MSMILTKQQQDTILQELNNAVDNPVWGKSKFLTVIGKKIASIRDEFKALLSPPKKALATPDTVVSQSGQQTMTRVYISIYCAKGGSINNWLSILAALPNQLASRPIYLEEEQVIDLLRAKINKENEAYISIDIPTNSLVQLVQDKIPLDKLGHQLATVKGKPINKYFTCTFVHSTGKYRYVDRQLIKCD
ncbi:MAG: Dot/Icm secretion system protein IcmQ [Legionellales bacterium RIFCSPHIGHO2_12_FULL_37_14]|nr:MAG: Dot/Icm secretion system protein IcmQ [Legionellales bacterium RIFCSPHIGHO2_12_FULL_37_14]